VVAGMMAAEIIKLLTGHGPAASQVTEFDLASGRWLTSQIARNQRCRFSHDVVRERLFLPVPFPAATIADLLATVATRFGNSNVQLEFRRRIFDSGAFGGSRFVPAESLRSSSTRRLAELRLSADDLVFAQQQGNPSVVIALCPATSLGDQP
jgi:hypothetical protein